MPLSFDFGVCFQVLEVWSETTAPKIDYENLLRAQPNEKSSDEENAAAAAASSPAAFQEESSPEASEAPAPAPAPAKRRPTPKVLTYPGSKCSDVTAVQPRHCEVSM